MSLDSRMLLGLRDFAFNSLYWILLRRSDSTDVDDVVTFNSLYWIQERGGPVEARCEHRTFNSLYWIHPVFSVSVALHDIASLFQFFVLDSEYSVIAGAPIGVLKLSILCIGFLATKDV